MKYFTKKQILKLAIGLPLLIGGTIGATIGLKIGVGMLETYQNSIRDVLSPATTLVSEEKSNATKANGIAMAKQICREGTVLVKNSNNTLPLGKDVKKVNVFGHGSVDWVVGGSGSGQVAKESGVSRTTILPALENCGIKYNTALSDYYLSFNSSDINSRSSLKTYYKDFYLLVEPKISEYQSILNESKSFSNTALVVISRTAGESEDPPRIQYKTKYSADTSRHYLQISTEEEELLKWVGNNFENVVVLINSTNCMELGFLDTIPGLDSCLVCGTSGNNGAEGIVQVLMGSMKNEEGDEISVSPSGRLSDIYPYSFDYNINVNHSGLENVNHYTDAGNIYPVTVSGRNAGISHSTAPSYVDYLENIYVGYKWFETADAEGYWNKAPYSGYEKVVQYPFGYGLSYTTFDWSIKSVEPAVGSKVTNKDTIKITMSVKNTGNFSGKDVIQAYLTAPYTKGGIEKSYVNLVGVYKTIELDPNKESTDFVLEIKVSDFESYDCYDKNNNGFKGFELEKGEYQIKLMTNSHVIKDVNLLGTPNSKGILKFNVDNTIKVEKDEITDKTVKNLFTGDSAIDGDSIDGSSEGVDIKNYISRASFPAISTNKVNDRKIGEMSKAHNLYTVKEAQDWDKATGNDAFGNPINTNKPKWGVGTKQALFKGNIATELGLELGADYNDPRWEAVLDAVPFAEAYTVMNSRTLGKGQTINSVGHNASFYDYDGPAQINSFNSAKKPGTGYPNATVLAQTFSPNLAYQYGLSFATDMATQGTDGVYGFGCNIHRSPFQGRNYEYLSEDAYLTGIILQNEVKGLNNKGKYCFLKHLALAETEYEREAMYVYVTEQALREIYLKPFKMAIQNEGCVGLMTSYNRIGSTWCGCSEALIEGVIRHEYGFNGAIITDYSDHNEYMNHGGSFRAGGNFGMACTLVSSPGFSNLGISTSSSGRLQNRLRDALHQVLYTWLAPQYKSSIYVPSDGDIDSSVSSLTIDGWFWLEPIVDLEHGGRSLKIFVYGLLTIGFYFVIRPFPPKLDEDRKKKTIKEAK